MEGLKVGDIGLTAGTDRIDDLIRFAESRRYGRKSMEARWSHAFIVTSELDGGAVTEAVSHGVVRNPLSRFATTAHVIYRPNYPEGGARLAANFVAFKVGDRYGYIEIASLALALLTQTKVRFGVEGQYICSGLVGAALDHAGLDMPDSPEWCTPADIQHVALAQQWPLIVPLQ